MPTATILAGDTFVTVTHGLGYTPTLANILLTPQDDLGGRGYWPSNTGAITHQVNIASMDLVDHVFGIVYVGSGAAVLPTPYSVQADVERVGRFKTDDFSVDYGYNYATSVERAIQEADALIDDYCLVPSGYFTGGGVTVTAEKLNGLDLINVGDLGGLPGWSRGGGALLRFKYGPMLSVTSLEEETTQGTWTARTEGRDSDFVVVPDGVAFMANSPSSRYSNVRVTYVAGYAATPRTIQAVSARLAASIVQSLVDAQNPNNDETRPLGLPVLSKELKESLDPYRLLQVVM